MVPTDAVAGFGRSGVVPVALAPLMPQRFVWESRYGVIVIDVAGEQVYVNGDLVALVPESVTPQGFREASQSGAACATEAGD